MHRRFIAASAALASFVFVPCPQALAADPDGICSPVEESLDRCFETAQGFVAEVVPGRSGEFPVIDANGNSEFTYLVTGPGAAGGSCAHIHDVSHVSIQIPVCTDAPLVILMAGPGARLLTDGHGDPSCDFGSGDLGHDVLKWDVPVDCNEAVLFTVVFQGVLPAAPMAILLKEGQSCTEGTILGPGCGQGCGGVIGNFVWLDLDGDGIQEGGEAGLPGVTLQLTNSSATQVGETVTDADGGYLFSGLCPDTYTVTVVASSLPTGVEASPCQAGGDSSLDNDCSPSSTTLTTGQMDVRTVNFGYVPVPFVYCESHDNSTGDPASIGYEGTPSISANDFSLTATGLPPGQPGQFFFGTQQTSVPFGDGVRCINGTVRRFRKIAIQVTGEAEVHFDFTLPPLTQIVPGVPYYFQLYYRDPMGGGAGFNTTDALCVIFAP